MGTRMPRLVLQISTTTTPASSTAAIFTSTRLAGGTTRPRARRREYCSHVLNPKAPATASITIQLAASVRLPLAMSLMTVTLMGRAPPLPRISSITPCRPSRPARVTTNEGRPSLVMIVPCTAPMAAQVSKPTMMAAHHGHAHDSFTSSAMTTPPTPLTNPMERSISPRSRAKTSPMASIM